MAPEDSRATFLRIPWAASLIRRPNVICRVPNSRLFKTSTEDSLFAETLKTSRTLRSCLIFYQKPSTNEEDIPEAHILFTLGDGMNGHANVMHGGILATLIDEGMGMLEGASNEWKHLKAVALGKAEGELPPKGTAGFTADLKVKFLRPAQTPGSLMVTARLVKREGRKKWYYAEVKQRENAADDYDGDEVVCATGEALFIEPRSVKL